jgi:hypothetical protein
VKEVKEFANFRAFETIAMYGPLSLVPFVIEGAAAGAMKGKGAGMTDTLFYAQMFP